MSYDPKKHFNRRWTWPKVVERKGHRPEEDWFAEFSHCSTGESGRQGNNIISTPRCSVFAYYNNVV
jgi:hypothetical protein